MPIVQIFSPSPYQIVQIDPAHPDAAMQQKLKEFERSFEYPLTAEKKFRIVHGKEGGNYFGFVNRLGNGKCYVAINKKDRYRTMTEVDPQGRRTEKRVLCKKGEIAGIFCGALR